MHKGIIKRYFNAPFSDMVGFLMQPPTPIHVDNTTTVGIVNNTIKRQQSRSMEMRYFWLLDQATQKYFKFFYQPGQENLADYPSKHHFAAIHRHTRPYYLHMPNSPKILIRASKPSARRGCVETLGDPYHKRVPLPRVPNTRTHDTQTHQMSVQPKSVQSTRLNGYTQRTSAKARLVKRLDTYTNIMSKLQ